MSRLRSIEFLLVLSVAFVAALTSALPSTGIRAAESGRDAAALARQILDDSRPEAERKQLILDHPRLSLKLLEALVADMPAHDLKEEYRRIPWIWRVAIAAAKRNDRREIKPILEFSVPRPKHGLRDWKAVVLGGGLINGIGLVGSWPDDEINEMIGHDGELRLRWERVLQLAAAMADDPNVFNGTRYDALRIIGVDTWDRRGAQLSRYLIKGKGIDDELVQGAIGGLGTMRSPHVAAAILSQFPHYNEENKGFALDALLKDRQRASALLDAIEAGVVKPGDLGPARTKRLTLFPDAALRARARKLLAATS